LRYVLEIYEDALQVSATHVPIRGMQFLYFCITLSIGCYASSQGATPLVVIPIAMLLTLPNIRRQKSNHVLTIETVVQSANALVFAMIAYAVGRGIAIIVGL
jgi:hypothetical protein